ncbi:hypothetical protein FHY31_004224 [Xanthomonas euvesicatoria]|uniref:Uncharacterized protein n=1 Tax=Xanthomonas euvesicatoria TaxID=456327 RepID=A0AAW3U9A2_XANEU|nr:hypothetical protein [Xanthomonas euvesicatoria]MBB4872405.1 hypothetical protein [Xanthomonas euvesicatoria]
MATRGQCSAVAITGQCKTNDAPGCVPCTMASTGGTLCWATAAMLATYQMMRALRNSVRGEVDSAPYWLMLARGL